jgi:tetratricopeptide (TPR) repeat protein
VTLTWSSQNALDLDLEPGVGKVQPNGSTSVTPQTSTTYTLTASGAGGTPETSSAQVTVTPANDVTPPPPPPPIKTNKPDMARIRAAIKRGDGYLHRSQYDQAISAYKEGAALDPQNSEVSDRLSRADSIRRDEAEGDSWLARGDAERAIAAYQEGLGLDPSNTVLPAKIRNASAQRRPTVDQKAVKAKIAEGDFYLKRGEYDSAISAYQDALKLDPNSAEAADKIAKARKAQEIENKVLH